MTELSYLLTSLISERLSDLEHDIIDPFDFKLPLPPIFDTNDWNAYPRITVIFQNAQHLVQRQKQRLLKTHQESPTNLSAFCLQAFLKEEKKVNRRIQN